MVENTLKSYNPLNNTWQSYSFSSVLESPFGTLGFGDLVIDNNGNKWAAAFGGVFGIKTDGGNSNIKRLAGEDEGNLPSNNIWALQIDNRNQLWIGTGNGLRVIYNPEAVFTEENPRTEEIIVINDNMKNVRANCSSLMYWS